MKRIFALVLCAAILLILPACAQSGTESDLTESAEVSSAVSEESSSQTVKRDGSLTVYTWSLMLPQTVIDDFTEETGISVDYQEFDSEQTMLERLRSGQNADYDLIICNDSTMEQVITEELAQKLDQSKLSNRSEINPLYQGLSFDPENEYTMPYGAAVQGIVYNPDMVGEITCWNDLWSEKLKGKLGLVPNSSVTVGMALKVMGEDYATTDTDALKAAEELLSDLVPNVKAVSEMDLPQLMADGELGAAVMYPTQAVATVLANENLKLCFPDEGTGFGVQEMFIPATAENADETHEFINYLLRPEIAVRCFEYLGMSSTNTGADSLLSDAYAPLLALPKNYIEIEPLQTDPAVSEKVKQIWTDFRAECEK